MDFIGKIYKIGPVVTRGQNNFQSRDVILEEVSNNQYPNYIPFQFAGQNVNRIDGFAEGEMVMVTYDLRGRRWTNPQGEERILLNLNAWRVVRYDANVAAQIQQGQYAQGGGFQQPYPQQPGFQGQPYQMGGYQQPVPQGYPMPPNSVGAPQPGQQGTTQVQQAVQIDNNVPF